MIFIVLCLAAVIVTAVFLYLKEKEEAAYEKIELQFIMPQSSYEIGTKLNAYEFIKKTNAADVNCPKIKTNKVGERSFIYIAYDEEGNHREFGLILNFVDPTPPVLILKQTEVSITEGDSFNAKDYVQDAYDPIEGKLKVKIIKPKDYLSVGVHQITYQISDKNKNKVKVILTLTVKEKAKEEQKPKEGDNNAIKPSNGPTEGETPLVAPSGGKAPASFMFVNGYTMPGGGNSAYDACMVYKGSAAGSCNPVFAEDGFTYIGVIYTPR